MVAIANMLVMLCFMVNSEHVIMVIARNFTIMAVLEKLEKMEVLHILELVKLFEVK